jgi:hypothetical protein
MPMACARCGALNPDGNLYCQSCGTAFSARPGGVATAVAPAAIPGPPPGPPPAFAAPAYAPPVAGSGGYQSPYYAPPPGPPTSVHRTPWTMIIAGVVGLTVVMAGFGTALAIIGSRSSSTASNNTTTTTSGIALGLPTPSPGVAPSPVGTQTSGGTPGTASNDGVSMPLPAGWTLAAKDTDTIVLYDPDSMGSVAAASGPSNPTQTAQDNMNTVDQYFKDQSPDARHCPGTQTTSGAFNGAKGIYWSLCFTITSSGHSVPAAAQMFAGANASGSVYYLVMVVTRDGNLSSYLNTAKPVLEGIHWKLS